MQYLEERDFTLVVLYREDDVLKETAPIRVFADTPEAAAYKAIGEKLVTRGRLDQLRARAWHLGIGHKPDMSLLFVGGDADGTARELEPFDDLTEVLEHDESDVMAQDLEAERDA